MANFPRLSRSPDWSGFKQSLVYDPTLRAMPEDGKVITRAQSTSRKRRWTLSYSYLTDNDKAILDAFQDEVAVGAEVFNWIFPKDNAWFSNADCMAFWRMEDDDADTNVLDGSPNEHDGVLAGGDDTSDISIVGKVGNALNLDGAADYISVAHHADLIPGEGSFSISLWFYADSVATIQRILFKATGALSGYYIGFVLRSGTLRCAFGDGVVATEAVESSGFITGVWYHVVVVRDKTAGYIYLYVNNALKDSEADSTNDIDDDSSLYIGGRPGPQECLNGIIDEVMIFQYALSLGDISYLYNSGDGIIITPQVLSVRLAEPLQFNIQDSDKDLWEALLILEEV